MTEQQSLKATASRFDRFKLITAFFVVGIISLVQPGCDCSSSSNSTPPSPSPAVITAVFPASNSSNVLVSTEISAVFSIDMNAATVIAPDAFTLTLGGITVATSVTYNALTKIASLIPLSDLLANTQYIATVASSVQDINGNSPLSNDFVWSFTTSPAMQLVSKNINGVTGNNVSRAADIDSTGRYIVFESTATNLSAVTTTSNRLHVYRKDTVTGEVILVSSDASGLVEAEVDAVNPGISSNGRYVVFQSAATNLDTSLVLPGTLQIYLKDLQDGSVDMVSRNFTLAPDNGPGAKNASVSDDGRFVVFESAATNLDAVIASGGVPQIYLKDMSDESVEMVSRDVAGLAGNGASINPDMSADGTHIVFESIATNYTSTNGVRNIFYVNTNVVHFVEQISRATGVAGAEADSASNNPSVSDDGSIVVFDTNATNLDVLDTKGITDVYFRNRTSSFTILVSAVPATSISGNDLSSNARISGDAIYVVFESRASDLIAADTDTVKDIFVRDLSALPAIDIDRVNITVSGSQATVPTNQPVISTDGRYVSFHSIESYTLDETDGLDDVFRAQNSTFQ